MSTILRSPAPSWTAEAPFPWERQIRPALDATLVASDSPVRAILVGSAGSGKTSTLRHLQRLLAMQGRTTTFLSADVVDAPPSHVLLIDDAHRLDIASIELLCARAEDADAGLIVAGRPWPTDSPLSALSRRLEQSRAAIVLGHLSRTDVLGWLHAHGRSVPDDCVEQILEATGGVTWLVTEALRTHDERDCGDNGEHTRIAETLGQQIAHRLTTIDPCVRRAIEQQCVAPPGHPLGNADVPDDVGLQGFAAGLLSRNGHPLPIVRAAVHMTIPVGRLVELSGELAAGLAALSTDSGTDAVEWVGLVHDSRLADALVRHADRMLRTRPARAAELYRGALESGIDPATIAARRARAAWAVGDIDAAGAIIDDTPADDLTDARDDVTDICAAIWAARGMMTQARAVYDAFAPERPDSAARELIAAVATGDATKLTDPTVAAGSPTALGVSMQLLRRGLAASIASEPSEAMLADLVRAAEMYTTSHTDAAVPELPAVIAATTALNLGGVGTAAAVVDEAVTGGHGGPWARARLLLWRAWIAVQRGRPAEARIALDQARAASARFSTRDELLAQGVQVAIARRYEDATGLEAAWRQARGTILRADMDLFLLHPLAEFISSASRVGDNERLHPHFARALEICDQLGGPPLWSAHLRWAGIQQGILQNRPEALTPHAKALVTASAHSRVAAIMARAGRVWTEVLGGTVDPDAVETAAKGLASAGLLWDAARLAGHGAGRTEDRKVAARLLACARELHPTDGGRRPVSQVEDEVDLDAGASAPQELLSEREEEVARLVLQGKTYAEIGETIFISPRTAEHHIAHIRQRLGATSRSELIAKLRVLFGGEGSS